MNNYLTFSVTAFMAAMVWATPGDSSERYEPGDNPLCEEVAHEINEAYVEGILTYDEGHQIIDHCFEY